LKRAGRAGARFVSMTALVVSGIGIWVIILNAPAALAAPNVQSAPPEIFFGVFGVIAAAAVVREYRLGSRLRLRAAVIDRGIPMCVFCGCVLDPGGPTVESVACRCPKCGRRLMSAVVSILAGAPSEHSRAFEMCRLAAAHRRPGWDDAIAFARSESDIAQVNIMLRRRAEPRVGAMAIGIWSVLPLTCGGWAAWSLVFPPAPPLGPTIPLMIIGLLMASTLANIVRYWVCGRRWVQEYFASTGVPFCIECGHDSRFNAASHPAPARCPNCDASFCKP
jgi:hypothetical protein